MWKLVPIVIISLVMTWVSKNKSGYEIDAWGERFYIRKERLIYGLMAFAMAFFAGLRTAGNDTFTYRQMYESLEDGTKAISQIQWTHLAEAPGLQFVCTLLKNMGATTQDYFMIFALFTVSTYLWFIRKYANQNILLSVYFFITMGVYTFTMAAIKQTVAVAFLLIATDRAVDRKYGRFLLWLLVAELFHPYAFIYLIVPLMFFSPWSWKTWILLGGTVVIALGMTRFMGGIVAITDVLGADYDETEFIGEGVNIFRVAVVWVPVVISFLGRRAMRRTEDRVVALTVNLTMVNAVIMFIGLFGTANYFARLANYFLIFQTLSLPWLFRLFEKRSKHFVIAAAVVCYFIFFYYDHVLANGAFDNAYRFMSIREFVNQLF